MIERTGGRNAWRGRGADAYALRNAEVGDAGVACLIDENIMQLEVAVHQPLLVDLAHAPRHRQRDLLLTRKRTEAERNNERTDGHATRKHRKQVGGRERARVGPGLSGRLKGEKVGPAGGAEPAGGERSGPLALSARRNTAAIDRRIVYVLVWFRFVRCALVRVGLLCFVTVCPFARSE